MKNSKKLLTMLLTGMLSISLSACGGNNTSTGSGNSAPATSNSEAASETQKEESPIKSLTAVSANAKVKIGEQANTANFYELVGVKTLTAKTKKVVITSSDESIIKVASTYKTMTALALGTATITVTSEVDKTKTCSFEVTVEDCFFDRTVASMGTSWDVEHEMDETNPSIRINTNNADGIYARNSDGLRWYIETSITIHAVDSTELWPKFGIVANTLTNTTETANNKVYFFLDAAIKNAENPNTAWTNFGVCEVANGSSWAWNSGVGNNEARHNDAVASVSSPITYETTFSMGMLHDGFNFHLYVNGNYMASVKALEGLMGNYDDEANDGSFKPASAMAGFFSFNSDVTFSNYKLVTDEAQLTE